MGKCGHVINDSSLILNYEHNNLLILSRIDKCSICGNSYKHITTKNKVIQTWRLDINDFIQGNAHVLKCENKYVDSCDICLSDIEIYYEFDWHIYHQNNVIMIVVKKMCQIIL